MDEKKIQQQRRDHEEKSTESRAAVLALPYLDSRQFEQELTLVKEGMMTIEEMHRYRMVPLQMGGRPANEALQYSPALLGSVIKVSPRGSRAYPQILGTDNFPTLVFVFQVVLQALALGKIPLHLFIILHRRLLLNW